MSGGLIKRVVSFLAPDIKGEALKDIVSALQFIVRKGAHFALFGVLGIFSFMTFVSYTKIHLTVRFFLSLVVSVAYAVSDEYHQTLVKGRSGALRDVLIDSVGALSGILLSLIIYKIYIAIKNRGQGKMKKKQYMELTQQLSQRLNGEKQRNEELSEENSALNKQLAELRDRITALENVKVTEPEITAAEEPLPIEASTKEPELSEGIRDGAKIIGKIVLSSAEYCNKLTELGANPNVKELVNLILGRTEVAKAEILRLSALNIDPKERFSAMERELSEAEDYFKSVMAQK